MATHPDISVETHRLGDDSAQTLVRAEQCDALAAHHIAHVAVVDAAVPYTMVRTHLSGAFMQVCLAGEGCTLLDGRWSVHRPGRVSFSPAHVRHAFHCVPGTRWRLAWVRFMPSSPHSVDGAMAPTITPFDGRVLEHAILGLAAEMAAAADPGTCAVWVDVIERYVARILAPLQREPRLVTLWNAVRADLARDWNVAEMAAIATTSEEHLRRLCQQRLGRSPGRQLATIRMAHAAHLLATGDLKVEVIARLVGYVNPFAFSNTFKRVTGFRPSEYRLRPRGTRHDGEEDGH
ncbi:helix-turn-helix transcriptional regulator [Piscinibacter sakaiensis]|uniref:Transcriptional regulator, AraC family n=1 Tax=Piscinibacter sakaiensis TaxID=1547922 RepID=A0A0K8P5M8_PISS1|nr:helix-turn-helix transcriptional regulator [Piscinibacter sakaiensis]GAP38018.1 transcriptional regulator, AraC family [Piscinibacter sakaiensis]